MVKYPKILYENEFVKFVKYETGIYGIEDKSVVEGNEKICVCCDSNLQIPVGKLLKG